MAKVAFEITTSFDEHKRNISNITSSMILGATLAGSESRMAIDFSHYQHYPDYLDYHCFWQVVNQGWLLTLHITNITNITLITSVFGRQ